MGNSAIGAVSRAMSTTRTTTGDSARRSSRDRKHRQDTSAEGGSQSPSTVLEYITQSTRTIFQKWPRRRRTWHGTGRSNTDFTKHNHNPRRTSSALEIPTDHPGVLHEQSLDRHKYNNIRPNSRHQIAHHFRATLPLPPLPCSRCLEDE